MIKELFLPLTRGKQRVLSQRIVGYGLDETQATAAVVYATSSKTTVEALHVVELEDGNDSTYNDRAVAALKALQRKVGKHEHVRIAIPASLVILKEVKVPFIDPDKIKMVIEYEVESMLPFTLDEAVIDFIITETAPAEQSSQVLVAAVRIQDLQSVLELYQQAEIKIQDITIDLFALYGLYQQIPEYKAVPQASALIDIGTRTTRIAFLYKGELRFMRTIQKGVASVAKLIAEDTGKTIEAVLAHFHASGFSKTSDEPFNLSVEKHLINFFHEIQFTLNSFSLKINYYENINKILFTGLVDLFPDFIKFCNQLLQTPCELFAGEKLLTNPLIKSTIKPHSWSSYLIALGTAIVCPNHYEFNLRRKVFAEADHELATKQIITGMTLCSLLFVVLFTHGYLQISNLADYAEKAEQREIEKLKPLFADNPKALSKKKDFKKIIQDAEQIFTEHKEAWDRFAHVHLDPVGILYELTRDVDRRRFGATLDSLHITIGDDNKPLITVTGLFKSSTEDHYTHFAEWYNNGFKESRLFECVGNPDVNVVEGNAGTKFTLSMRLKDQ